MKTFQKRVKILLPLDGSSSGAYSFVSWLGARKDKKMIRVLLTYEIFSSEVKK